MQRMFSNVKASRLQLVKLSVWLVFISALIFSAVLADGRLGGETAGAGGQVTAASSAAVPQASLGPSGTNASAPVIGDTGRSVNPQFSAADPDEYLNDSKMRDPSKLETLPAWRWSNFNLEAAEGGFLDISGGARAAMSGIASLLFLGANFIWEILLSLIRFAMTVDILGAMATPINNAISSLSGSLFVILGAIWALVLFRFLREAFAGRGKKAAIGLVLFSLTVGGIYAIGNSSEGKTNVNDRNTMPYYAQLLINSLDKTAVNMGTGFGVTGGQTMGVPPGKQGTDNLRCEVYVDRLYDSYNAANNKKPAPNVGTLQTLSKLWQSTFVASWTTAQFGPGGNDIDLGSRVACRQLEINSGIPATDQRTMNNIPEENLGTAVYGGFRSTEQDLHIIITTWAACTSAGGAQGVTAPFSNEALTTNNRIEENCVGEGSYLQKSERLDRKSPLNLFFDNRELLKTDTTEHRIAQQWNEAYYGANTNERVVQGFLALAVAGIFFWSLGFIAAGLIVAQIAMIFLLMFIPITLLLIGLGMPQGMKLVKITGTTIASKFLFMFIIAFMTELIALGQQIVNGIGDGKGTISQILYAIIPLLVLLLMNKMAKGVGMPGMFKPMGALGFMMAASAAATRDQSIMSASRSATDSALRSPKAAAGMAMGVGRGTKSAVDSMTKLGRKTMDWAKRNKKDVAESEENGYSTFNSEANSEANSDTNNTTTNKEISEKKIREKILTEREDKGLKAKTGKIFNKTRDYATLLKENAAGAGKFAVFHAAGAAGKDVLGLAGGGIKAGVGAVGSGIKAGINSAGGQKLSTILGGVGAGGLGAVAAAGLAMPLAAAPLLIGAAAVIGGKAVKNQFDKRKVTPTPYTVGKDLYVEDAEAASRGVEATARTINSAEGQERTELEREHTAVVLDNAQYNRVGSDFVGFTSYAEQAGAAESYAQNLGLSRNEVVMGANGLAVPVAMKKSEARSKLSIENMAHGIHWLDNETRERRPEESDEMYTARMHVSLSERGLMTASGKAINVFEKHGLDPKGADKERIEAWMNGNKDKLLDSIKYTSKDSAAEARKVQQATVWISNQQDMQVERAKVTEIMLVQAVEAAQEQRETFEVKFKEIDSKVEAANRSFEVAVAAERALPGETDQKKIDAIRANARKVRKDWTSATDTKVTEFFETIDSMNTLLLDMQAPKMENSGELIQLAENYAKEMEREYESILTLQAKASTGDTAALSSLQNALAGVSQEISKKQEQLDTLTRENTEMVERFREQAAQDQAKVGEVKEVKSASQYLRDARAFPG